MLQPWLKPWENGSCVCFAWYDFSSSKLCLIGILFQNLTWFFIVKLCLIGILFQHFTQNETQNQSKFKTVSHSKQKRSACFQMIAENSLAFSALYFTFQSSIELRFFLFLPPRLIYILGCTFKYLFTYLYIFFLPVFFLHI